MNECFRTERHSSSPARRLLSFQDLRILRSEVIQSWNVQYLRFALLLPLLISTNQNWISLSLWKTRIWETTHSKIRNPTILRCSGLTRNGPWLKINTVLRSDWYQFMFGIEFIVQGDSKPRPNFKSVENHVMARFDDKGCGIHCNIRRNSGNGPSVKFFSAVINHHDFRKRKAWKRIAQNASEKIQTT